MHEGNEMSVGSTADEPANLFNSLHHSHIPSFPLLLVNEEGKK
jgi:hypothetical protein